MKITILLIIVGIICVLVYLPLVWTADTRIFCISVGAIVFIGASIALRYNTKRL